MTDKAKQRKETPVFSGVVMYFPDALRAISQCSLAGNKQHNPGKPLHWDRSKSTDHLDALMRHLMEAGTIDDDNIRHSTKVAWRALANLQKEIEDSKLNENKLNEKICICNFAKQNGFIGYDESDFYDLCKQCANKKGS